MLGANAARAMEPELFCIGALHSPETGIIDGHAYMLALRGDLEDLGGAIALNTPVKGALRKSGQWHVLFGGDGVEFAFDAVVNCAGLGAQAVARSMRDYPAARVPRLILGKGNYFTYAGKPAFSRLIYPTPIVGGLGVHVTLDLAGRMRFGPDVEWVERENYDVDPTRANLFYERIRTYWPGLPEGSLAPDYSGIRPKLTGPKEPQADFLIDAPAQHGLPGLVQLFGIELPGLTQFAVAGRGSGRLSRKLSAAIVIAARAFAQRHRRRARGVPAGRHDLHARKFLTRALEDGAVAADRREIGHLVFHAGERHKAAPGRDDVAGPQRRIGVDVHMRESEAIAAVAGAAGNELLAVEECGVEIGVAAAVGGDRVVDAGCRNKAASDWPDRRRGTSAPRLRRHAPAPGSKSRRSCARSSPRPGRLRPAAPSVHANWRRDRRKS